MITGVGARLYKDDGIKFKINIITFNSPELDSQFRSLKVVCNAAEECKIEFKLYVDAVAEMGERGMIHDIRMRGDVVSLYRSIPYGATEREKLPEPVTIDHPAVQTYLQSITNPVVSHKSSTVVKEITEGRLRGIDNMDMNYSRSQQQHKFRTNDKDLTVFSDPHLVVRY